MKAFSKVLEARRQEYANNNVLCSKGCCRECHECNAKPGAPRLCPSCLELRTLCNSLTEKPMSDPVKVPCEICGMESQYGYFRCQEHKVLGPQGRQCVDLSDVPLRMTPSGLTYEQMKRFLEVGTANSKQIGGEHYKKHGVSGEQHWDRIIRLYPDSAHIYFIAAATKYIERYRDKNGIQDLEKAIHYIEKLIEFEKSRETVNPTNPYTERIKDKPTKLEPGPKVRTMTAEDVERMNKITQEHALKPVTSSPEVFKVKCPTCGGLGRTEQNSLMMDMPCRHCVGTGFLEVPVQKVNPVG